MSTPFLVVIRGSDLDREIKAHSTERKLLADVLGRKPHPTLEHMRPQVLANPFFNPEGVGWVKHDWYIAARDAGACVRVMDDLKKAIQLNSVSSSYGASPLHFIALDQAEFTQVRDAFNLAYAGNYEDILSFTNPDTKVIVVTPKAGAEKPAP